MMDNGREHIYTHTRTHTRDDNNQCRIKKKTVSLDIVILFDRTHPCRFYVRNLVKCDRSKSEGVAGGGANEEKK